MKGRSGKDENYWHAKAGHPRPGLPGSRRLPDHRAYIAAHHFAKAKNESFLNTSGELVFGDGGKPKRLVKRDQDNSRMDVDGI